LKAFVRPIAKKYEHRRQGDLGDEFGVGFERNEVVSQADDEDGRAAQSEHPDFAQIEMDCR
jgi:hypothetical protein